MEKSITIYKGTIIVFPTNKDDFVNLIGRNLFDSKTNLYTDYRAEMKFHVNVSGGDYVYMSCYAMANSSADAQDGYVKINYGKEDMTETPAFNSESSGWLENGYASIRVDEDVTFTYNEPFVGSSPKGWYGVFTDPSVKLVRPIGKVTFNGQTLIDLTEDTVTAADVAAGKTFHLASGALATGTATGGGSSGGGGTSGEGKEIYRFNRQAFGSGMNMFLNADGTFQPFAYRQPNRNFVYPFNIAGGNYIFPATLRFDVNYESFFVDSTFEGIQNLQWEEFYQTAQSGEYEFGEIIFEDKRAADWFADKFGVTYEVETIGGGSSTPVSGDGIPVEISTEAEMDAFIVSENKSKVAKYVGPAGKYQTDSLYLIEEK